MTSVRAVLQVLRGYLSAVLLGLAAILLLALGAPSKAALAAAGFAFLGAAVTRSIDLAGNAAPKQPGRTRTAGGTWTRRAASRTWHWRPGTLAAMSSSPPS
jgi:hypothetical protein